MRPGTAHLRVARPTDDIEANLRFYRDGLGLPVLYRFEDHEQFDGVMLGVPGQGYHLEITRHHTHRNGRSFEDPDGYRVVFQNTPPPEW